MKESIMNELFCVFSIDNNYDQPENNLEGVFLSKPTIEELLAHFAVSKDNDDAVCSVVNLWQGKRVRIDGETEYRLEKIKIGWIL